VEAASLVAYIGRARRRGKWGVMVHGQSAKRAEASDGGLAVAALVGSAGACVVPDAVSPIAVVSRSFRRVSKKTTRSTRTRPTRRTSRPASKRPTPNLADRAGRARSGAQHHRPRASCKKRPGRRPRECAVQRRPARRRAPGPRRGARRRHPRPPLGGAAARRGGPADRSRRCAAPGIVPSLMVSPSVPCRCRPARAPPRHSARLPQTPAFPPLAENRAGHAARPHRHARFGAAAAGAPSSSVQVAADRLSD